MKKILIVAFFAALIIPSSAYSKSPSSYNNDIITNVDPIILTLDLGDISEASEAEILKKVDSFLKKNLTNKDGELECSVTVKGTIDVGVAEFEISVTVSGPCSEVIKNGKAIAGAILKEVKDYISDQF